MITWILSRRWEQGAVASIFTGDAGNRLHLKMDIPSNSPNFFKLVILLPWTRQKGSTTLSWIFENNLFIYSNYNFPSKDSAFVFSKHIHLGFGFNTRNGPGGSCLHRFFCPKQIDTLQVTGTCGHFLKLDNDSGKHGALGEKQKGHMKGLKQSMTCFFFGRIYTVQVLACMLFGTWNVMNMFFLDILLQSFACFLQSSR